MFRSLNLFCLMALTLTGHGPLLFAQDAPGGAADRPQPPQLRFPKCDVTMARYVDPQAPEGPLLLLTEAPTSQEILQTYNVAVPVQETLEYTAADGTTKTRTVTKYVMEQRTRTARQMGRAPVQIPPGQYKIVTAAGAVTRLPARATEVLAIATETPGTAHLPAAAQLLKPDAAIVFYHPQAARPAAPEPPDERKLALLKRLPSSDIATVSRRPGDNGTLYIDRGVPVTEQVEQAYTVQVPVTKVVNGQPVTEFVQEVRTRVVNVVKHRRQLSRSPNGQYEIWQVTAAAPMGQAVEDLPAQSRLAVLIPVDAVDQARGPQWTLFREGTTLVFYNPASAVPAPPEPVAAPEAPAPAPR